MHTPSRTAQGSDDEPGGDSPRVVIVVLNWHDPIHTESCLAALASLDYPAFEILLIDNGCIDFRDKSFDDDRIHYVHSADNLGYAGGANLGIERAKQRGAGYIWLLNNDATPEPDALATLVAAAEQSPGASALGPKILRTDHPDRIDSVAVSIDLRSGRFRLVGHGEIDHGQYDALREVDAVTGCAVLLRTGVLDFIGGFDERYFLYLEDLDLCLRIRAAGGTIHAVPEARVLHDRAPSGSGRQSANSLYYSSRNHYLMMATHGSGGLVRHAMRSATIFLANVAFAIRADVGAVAGRLSAVLAGSRDYVARRFGAR